jgi:hypothetical protein
MAMKDHFGILKNIKITEFINLETDEFTDSFINDFPIFRCFDESLRKEKSGGKDDLFTVLADIQGERETESRNYTFWKTKNDSYYSLKINVILEIFENYCQALEDSILFKHISNEFQFNYNLIENIEDKKKFLTSYLVKINVFSYDVISPTFDNLSKEVFIHEDRIFMFLITIPDYVENYLFGVDAGINVEIHSKHNWLENIVKYLQIKMAYKELIKLDSVDVDDQSKKRITTQFEALIYLQELGVIKILQEKQFNGSQIAEIFSKIIDRNKNNIASMLAYISDPKKFTDREKALCNSIVKKLGDQP